MRRKTSSKGDVRRKAVEILKVLREKVGIIEEGFVTLEADRRKEDPFKILIATILSQNTSGKNSIRAYQNLSKRFELKPDVLANADIKDIEDAIKVAGLYKSKSIAIKEVSKQILERYGGNLWKVLKKPVEEARKELLSLPKVGQKTADVLLLFVAKKPTIPIDTHIMRISKRLGFVDEKAGYEDVRRKLMEIFPRKSYLEAHLLLIMFGRRICRARKPLCSTCPIKNYCPYPSKTTS